MKKLVAKNPEEAKELRKIFATVDDIAEEHGISKRQAYRYMEVLEKLELEEREIMAEEEKKDKKTVVPRRLVRGLRGMIHRGNPLMRESWFQREMAYRRWHAFEETNEKQRREEAEEEHEQDVPLDEMPN